MAEKKITEANTENKEVSAAKKPLREKSVSTDGTGNKRPAAKKEVPAPARRMFESAEDRNKAMAAAPRRMFESAEDRNRSKQQQVQRRMLDGPEDRMRRPAAQKDGGQVRTGQKSGTAQKTGTRMINGVKISSADGDNRLIHGSYANEADLEALKAEKRKENLAKNAALKLEEEKKTIEENKKAEELAKKVKEESAEIEKNIAEQKKKTAEKKAAEAAKEAIKEASKVNSGETAKEAKESVKEVAKESEKETKTEKTSEKTAGKAFEKQAAIANTENAAPDKATEEQKPEKVFKTVNAYVRPTIIKRADSRDSGNGNVKQRTMDNRPAGRTDARGDLRRPGSTRPGDNRAFNRNVSDKNHFQTVESRYDGNNHGHSNLFENRSQRNGNISAGASRDSGFKTRNSGFSTRPKDFNSGNKDEDEKKPVSRARDPRKKQSAPEIAESMKQQNTRRNDKSKDREKQNKKFGDFEDGIELKKGSKSKDPNRAGAFRKPEAVKAQETEEVIKTITIPDMLTIQELADKMKIKGGDIVKKLFLAGKICSLNSDITFEEAENIALEYEIIAEHEEKVDRVAELIKEDEEDEMQMVKRPPVVCVMGHVDHGKTSLLDAIRTTNVTSREAGGITQHIGAYMVEINGQKITFLDTPGHEAFTAMRMRGANSTDIAVLVVAADDGVMPQTIEAINHAKAAGVEVIVAVNKIDKPTANVERVKQELTEYGLLSEDWGGSTVFVPVSAHTHEGIEKLLEMIILTSDVLELKANPNRMARGIVVEAQLDKGRGPVATVLVQKGTLHVGDNVVIGSSMGKVRALVNDRHEKVKCATPSMPVEVLGLNSVPEAGEVVVATSSEKEARAIAEAYIAQNKEKLIAETKSKLSLDGLYSQIQAGNIKELNIIVKADVQGSVEAIKQSLLKLSNAEVAVRIIHGGVGAINESDATLASASNAIIIGFNVKPDNTAKDICEREKVDLRLYNVIYNAIDDVEAAMKGMLDPIFEEQIIAHAEVRQTFKASGVGTIAGAYVLDGKIVRGCKARITRDNKLIFDGNLASLKRFKDDVKEVNAGYECGLVFEKFSDIIVGDAVELYQMVEVPRK